MVSSTGRVAMARDRH